MRVICQQWFFVFILLTSCASPSTKFLETAEKYGFSTNLEQGKPYLHRVFLNHAAQQKNFYEELHVYVDGDGTPFETANFPAQDPTARNSLILDLLFQDKTPAILLGRPCYYGLQLSTNCSPELWTAQRYSNEVVESLVLSLQQFLKKRPTKNLVFIGYSGGGTLVTFLTSHFPQTRSVVTIAGNLDTQAWCDFHDYFPLQESLNPIQQAKIPVEIKQFHFAGLADENVPAEMIKHFSLRQKNSRYIELENFTHECCWADKWANLLIQIR
jgi:pimeloyl-ACP methyl ester carboxylesterase